MEDYEKRYCVAVMVSHKSSPEGEQWVTHTFRKSGEHERLKLIRRLDAENIPYRTKLSRGE